MAKGEASSTTKVVATLCAHVKKCIAAVRFYGGAHERLFEMQQELFSELAELLDQVEELSLEFSTLAISYGGHVVLGADKHEDSLSYPLFLDGIQRITLIKGIPFEELVRLLSIWANAREVRENALHTFSTEFWEAGIQQIRLTMVETFYEKSDTNERENRKNEERDANQLRLLMDQISGEALAGGSSGDGAKAKLLRISKEDVALLRVGSINKLTQEDLRRQDLAARLPSSSLSASAAEDLLGGLLLDDRATAERAVRAFVAASPVAEGDEPDRLVALIRRILADALKKRAFDTVADAITPHAAHAWIGRALEDPELLAPIVDGLDHPDYRESAARILACLRADAAGPLLDRVSLVQTNDGRKRLMAVLTRLQPPPELLLERLASGDAVLAREILDLIRSYPDADARRVRQAALDHPSSVIRALVMKAGKPAELLAMRDRFYRKFDDPDPNVRRALLDLLMRASDRAAIPAIIKHLKEKKIDPEERKILLTALGRLGGPEAGALLRAEIEQQRSATLRTVAVLALVQAEGETARPVLEQILKKFFVRPSLKKAAQEGLRRIDALERGASRTSQLAVPVRASWEESDLIEAYLVDLSESGAFLEVSHAPDPGTRMSIMLGGAERPEQLLARVVRRTERGVGIEFEDLTPSGKQVLLGLLQESPALGESIVLRTADLIFSPAEEKLDSGDLVRAAKEKLQQGEPTAALARLRLARLQEPDHPEAKRLADRVSDTIANGAAESAYRQGVYYEEAGNFSLAAKHFVEAASIAPRNVAYAKKAGEASLARKSPEAACHYFSLALEIDPEDAEVRAQLARAHLMSGRRADALNEATQAVILAPDRRDLAELLLWIRHRPETIVDDLPRVMGTAPEPTRKDVELVQTSVEEALSAGDTATGIAMVTLALESEPNRAAYHALHARCLLEAGRTADAIAAAQASVVLEPTNEEHIRLLLWARSGGTVDPGTADIAVVRIERDLDGEPWNADLHADHARQLARTGRMREAIDAALRATQLEPNREDITRLLRELRGHRSRT